MRAGKRLDCFKNSYTGDPLASKRLSVVHPPGEPNWNMYLDSGPDMAVYVAPPEPEGTHPVEVHDEVIPEPHVVAATEHDETRHGAKNKHK